MPFRINHIHLKSPDPRKTADWYVKAFAFKIVSDETRVFGDRFIRCQSEDGGMAVNISGARTNEKLGAGDASAHHGLEHFGFDSEHLEADIARLEGLGAKLLEGPIQIPDGPRIASCRPRTTAARADRAPPDHRGRLGFLGLLRVASSGRAGRSSPRPPRARGTRRRPAGAGRAGVSTCSGKGTPPRAVIGVWSASAGVQLDEDRALRR